MPTSSQQTYIARLGFQDPDRRSARHGLACEYLYERILELEVAPWLLRTRQKRIEDQISWCENVIAGKPLGYYFSESDRQKHQRELPAWRERLSALTLELMLDEVRNSHRAGECLNVPITSRSYVNGFADVLVTHRDREGDSQARWLGEVKITPEPAESVLQQLNFYLSYLDGVDAVYILTDYDPVDLKRLCAGTKIKVYRLGQAFERWLTERPTPDTEEL
jgi:hypothetical protein